MSNPANVEQLTENETEVNKNIENLRQEVDALDIVDAAEFAAMSEEEQVEFTRQIDQSKHAYINNILAETFKDVKASGEFVDTLKGLVDHHVVDKDGVRLIPKFQDVLYNLSVYSACVLERLAFGQTYRTKWVDPTTFIPSIGASYMVMMNCGLILEATVDSMETDNLQLVLADSKVRIHKNRLLGINTAVTDATDFLRGTPKIAYSALERVEADTVPAPEIKINVTRSPAVISAQASESRNRAKRLRKKNK